MIAQLPHPCPDRAGALAGTAAAALPAAAARPAMRRVRIASAGLDPLHAVRLKVAVSLLLADFIDAELVEGQADAVDLLVGAAEDPAVQQRLLRAAAAGVGVLAISRSGYGGGGAALAQGASVRQIHEQLVHLLTVTAGTAQPRPQSVVAARSVLDWLARHPGRPCLLHNGLLRICVDGTRQQVALLRALSLADFAARLCDDGWSCEVLDPSGWEHALADAVDVCRWETLCWHAAVQNPAPLPLAAVSDSVRLRGWPALDASQLPVSWLIGVSALLQQPWQPDQLARAAGMAPLEVARIAAAAYWSGLLDGADAPGRVLAAGPMPGLLGRLARRLGLGFPLSRAGH